MLGYRRLRIYKLKRKIQGLKDKDFSSKDNDKDCIVKDKDQDKDCILVLKESLRTRTNITVIWPRIVSGCGS